MKIESNLGNPKIIDNPNLEENLNVNTAMKKDTLKEIVKFGRIETKKFKREGPNATM